MWMTMSLTHAKEKQKCGEKHLCGSVIDIAISWKYTEHQIHARRKNSLDNCILNSLRFTHNKAALLP